MPRYFFNIDDGQGSPNDEEGILLPGPEEARSEAVIAAGAMLKDLHRTFWQDPEWRMHVTDEKGVEICSLSISGGTRAQ